MDNYIFLEYEPLSSNESFIKSESFQVNGDDKFNINFQRRTKNGYTGTAAELVARVLLYGADGTYYTLDTNGTWVESNSTFTTFVQAINYNYTSENRDTWVSVTVKSNFIPKTGIIYIHLYEFAQGAFTGQETHFKDLRLEYIPYVEGKTFVNVTGDYNQITLDANHKDTADHEVFLSDSPKYLFKGALFLADGTTLTKLWYDMNFYPALHYPIKRFNAIQHYRMSYRNLLKITGDFLNWNDSEPLTPMHRVNFTNGSEYKVFMPLLLRDINTAKSDFSGLFVEVYDELYNYFDDTLGGTILYTSHKFDYIFKSK